MSSRVLFPADPMNPREVDPAYAREFAAASALELKMSLVDHEALVDEGDARRATRRVTESQPPELAVYRGWMLRPAAYASLHGALDARGVRLINSPEQYRHAH